MADYALLREAFKLEGVGRVQEALAAWRRVASDYAGTARGGDAQKGIESLLAKVG